MIPGDLDYDEFFDAEDLTAAEDSTVEAMADISAIKTLLKNNPEFFIEFFLHQELTVPVPQLHKEVWRLLTNTALQRVLLAIPRDHAKTTLSKLCVVWYFLFTTHRFCVYLSNTNTIAKNACKDIMNFLKSPNFEEVFGKIKIEKESETDSLWIFEIPVGNGKTKRCILRAVGAGQQMRGINIDNQRPDIAVIDDVEDNENTESPTLQAKLDRWIFGPFLKALARQKKVIWLGNMLQKTSLLSRLSRRENWNPVVFGALVRDSETGKLEPLWPDRWPLEELIEDFNEYRDLGLIETWMCEMMNMPGHGKDGFDPRNIYYVPAPIPGEHKAAFLVLDPAFGENATNDDSSITVHVIRSDGFPMVAEAITGKYSESELFDLMYALALKWDAWVWGIEAIAAQKVLITLFNVWISLKRINNHIEMIPLMAGRGDPKVSRIKSFISLMAKKEYGIFEGAVNFTTQAIEYNMTKKNNRDDELDSCAYGPQMISMYLPIILSSSSSVINEDENRRGRFGLEVCSV